MEAVWSFLYGRTLFLSPCSRNLHQDLVDKLGLCLVASLVWFFTAVTPSPKDTGYTLFASSKLPFEHLPAHFPLSMLNQTTWTVSTPSFGAVTMRGMPLVVHHPVTRRPCLRYHEHWPQRKTNFDPMEVAIDGCDEKRDEEIRRVIDSWVTYWHAWDKGDLVVNDNISMMHTRTAFTGGSDRELWRIHID